MSTENTGSRTVTYLLLAGTVAAAIFAGFMHEELRMVMLYGSLCVAVIVAIDREVDGASRNRSLTFDVHRLANRLKVASEFNANYADIVKKQQDNLKRFEERDELAQEHIADLQNELLEIRRQQRNAEEQVVTPQETANEEPRMPVIIRMR